MLLTDSRKVFILSIFALSCMFACLLKNTANAEELVLGVVPQQSPVKLSRLWLPLVKHLSNELGMKVSLHGSPGIDTFESRLMVREFDIAYVNPLQYVTSHRSAGYRVLAREKDKLLQSIIVVRQNSPLSSLADLQNKRFVFPENAFAAGMLVQAYLKKQGLRHSNHYVSTHDTAYSLVALGKMDAAGGVLRTFDSLHARVKEKLKVLKVIDGLTPHAFVVSPKVDKQLQDKIQKVLVDLDHHKAGRAFLTAVGFNPLIKAKDAEWNDIRELMSLDNL